MGGRFTGCQRNCPPGYGYILVPSDATFETEALVSRPITSTEEKTSAPISGNAVFNHPTTGDQEILDPNVRPVVEETRRLYPETRSV